MAGSTLSIIEGTKIKGSRRSHGTDGVGGNSHKGRRECVTGILKNNNYDLTVFFTVQ